MKRSHIVSLGGMFSSVRQLAAALRRDRINTYAAESAFFLILSAIPLLTLTVAAARIVIPDFVSEYIYRLAGLVPGIIGEYIESELLSFMKYSSPAPLSVSIIALAWGASRGIRAVRRGVRSVWGEGSDGALSELFYGFIFTAAFVIIIVAVLVFFVFGDTIFDAVGDRFPTLGGVFDVSPVLMLISLAAFFALALATFTPPSSGMDRLRQHLPGAALAASGWTLYSYIFSVFISDFSDMPHIYGSLAAIMVLMLWLYMIMYIFLLGAEVNKLMAQKRERRR